MEIRKIDLTHTVSKHSINSLESIEPRVSRLRKQPKKTPSKANLSTPRLLNKRPSNTRLTEPTNSKPCVINRKVCLPCDCETCKNTTVS